MTSGRVVVLSLLPQLVSVWFELHWVLAVSVPSGRVAVLSLLSQLVSVWSELHFELLLKLHLEPFSDYSLLFLENHRSLSAFDHRLHRQLSFSEPATLLVQTPSKLVLRASAFLVPCSLLLTPCFSPSVVGSCWSPKSRSAIVRGVTHDS